MTEATASLGDGELIGRRIFDKKLTVITSVSEVSANIFLDKRLDEDLSIDRLGNGSATKAVVKVLTVLSDAEAVSQKTQFLGWIATHRKNIKHLSVRPDPLTKAVDGIDNPHHGLIDRNGARETALAYHLSRSLLFTFRENGLIVSPLRQ